MNNVIYFDNSATTSLNEEVFNSMKEFLLLNYSNPSSVYEFSQKSRVAIEKSRENIDSIKYILKKLDLVLIMSVNPGFGGQKFIDYSLDKIRDLKELIKEKNSKALIEVDGGIKLDNAKEVIEAGADILVSGSGIFGENTLENIRKFKEINWKQQ